MIHQAQVETRKLYGANAERLMPAAASAPQHQPRFQVVGVSFEGDFGLGRHVKIR
jgi:hypothetical protein